MVRRKEGRKEGERNRRMRVKLEKSNEVSRGREGGQNGGIQRDQEGGMRMMDAEMKRMDGREGGRNVRGGMNERTG